MFTWQVPRRKVSISNGLNRYIFLFLDSSLILFVFIFFGLSNKFTLAHALWIAKGTSSEL